MRACIVRTSKWNAKEKYLSDHKKGFRDPVRAVCTFVQSAWSIFGLCIHDMDAGFHLLVDKIICCPVSPFVSFSQPSIFVYSIILPKELKKHIMTPGSRNSCDDIQLILTTTTLIGRASGCARSKGSGREHPRSVAWRSLFPPVANSINQSVYLSLVSYILQPVKTEPSLSRLFHGILSVTSTNSGGCSQAEITQAVLKRGDGSAERIASLLLEGDQLTKSLSDGNQRLSELEEELHFVKIKKSELIANTDLQVAETKTKCWKRQFYKCGFRAWPWEWTGQKAHQSGEYLFRPRSALWRRGL